MIMSYELEKRYLKKDGNVNEKALWKDAVDLPKSANSFEDYIKQFGTYNVYKKNIGKINIEVDVGKAFNHLTNNTYLEDRHYISGALYETINNPLIIIKNNKGYTLYKPFKEGEQTLHLTSLHIDNNGIANFKTFYEVNGLNKIKVIIKTPEVNVKFFAHLDGHINEETSKPQILPKTSPQNVGNLNDKEIIPKNNNLVKFDVEYTAGNLYTDLEAMETFKKEINDFWLRDYIKFDDRKTPERNIIYSQYLDTLRPHSDEYAGDLANASGKTNEDPNINQIIPKNNKKSS